MTPIQESTCERAWLAAAEHLSAMRDHRDFNLVVEIDEPAVHNTTDHRVRAVVDDFLRGGNAHPLSTVAGTIFPAAQYLEHGSRGVYEVYPAEVYPAIKEPREWGRYAHRLVHWPPSAESRELNPLKDMVEKMQQQLRGSAPKRACYELSLTDSAIDLPLYDPASDRLRIMSGPCLSHVSFKLGDDKTLYMTALYRSHYYVARALGNFLGLAALQAFVCEQTDLTPGPLLCVSSYAKVDALGRAKDRPGWGISAAKAMVRAARAALDEGQP